MVRVAEYSRDCLKALRADTGIAYDDRAQGTLQLFRTQKQLDGVHKDTEILDQYGVPYQVLDTAGYLQYEPALAGVMAGITTNISYWTWYGFPGSYTAGYTFTEMMGYVCIGIVVAAIVKNSKPVALSARAA